MLIIIGALPIYMGAPNIGDWLPGAKSVIKVFIPFLALGLTKSRHLTLILPKHWQNT